MSTAVRLHVSESGYFHCADLNCNTYNCVADCQFVNSRGHHHIFLQVLQKAETKERNDLQSRNPTWLSVAGTI